MFAKRCRAAFDADYKLIVLKDLPRAGVPGPNSVALQSLVPVHYTTISPISTLDT